MRIAGAPRAVHSGMILALVVVLALSGACTPGTPKKAEPKNGAGAAEPAPQPLRPRAAHTAAALPDGRVLIAGGCGTDGCETADIAPTSEFYTPGKGFSAGPRMLVPRSGHSATLLNDGRILIVGGFAREATPPVATAEVFDPKTGAFTAAGKLGVARGGHSAVRMADGRVLVAGGWIGPRQYTETVEFFDPVTNSFSPGPPMPSIRHAAPGVALADGRVLIAGGQEVHDRGLTSALVYVPESKQWQPVGPMRTPRFKHAMAQVQGGKVMVLGGTTDDRELLDSTEIFDPATNRFTAAASMTVPRFKFPDTIAVSRGALVVAAGTRVDAYDLASGMFRALTGPRPWRSSPSATTLPDGSVLIVGGYDEGIHLYRDAFLVHP